MARYEMPLGMRYATLEEREQFYSQELPLAKVTEWFEKRHGKPKFAVIIGRHTKIYPENYKSDAETTIIIDEYKTLTDVQGQILEFLPEAVYYDRNVYNSKGEKIGQELAFDLDPENVTCPVHGSLADKMKRKQGLSFCELELNIVRQETILLNEYLEAKNFSNLRIVYSGRGFHLHVLDAEAFKLTAEQRLRLAQETKKEGFHIDEWVTSGEMRLIRLPHSLNGLVSRIVLPLKKQDLESFNPVSDERCLPKFLGKKLIFS
jgi:DNA primase small subunit